MILATFSCMYKISANLSEMHQHEKKQWHLRKSSKAQMSSAERCRPSHLNSLELYKSSCLNDNQHNLRGKHSYIRENATSFLVQHVQTPLWKNRTLFARSETPTQDHKQPHHSARKRVWNSNTVQPARLSTSSEIVCREIKQCSGNCHVNKVHAGWTK